MIHIIHLRRLQSIVLFLVAICPPAEAQTVKADAPETAGAVITFTKPIKWYRVPMETGQIFSGNIGLDAYLQVNDKLGRPVVGQSVTLFARSRAGSLARATDTTDSGGNVRIAARFDVAPGSLSVELQACMTQAPEICTSVRPLRLRRWLDPSASIDISYSYFPHVSRTDYGKGVSLANSASQFVAAFRPEMRVNLWEKEDQFKYSGLSLQGGVTADVDHLQVSNLFYSKGVQTRTAVRNYYVGPTLQLRSQFAFGASYVVPVSDASGTSGVSSTGKQEPVNLSDGSQSLDLFGAGIARADSGASVLFSGYYSKARKRTLSVGTTGVRGDIASVDLSVPFRVADSLLSWGPYFRYTHFARPSITGSSTTTGSDSFGNQMEGGLSYRNQGTSVLGVEASAFGGRAPGSYWYFGARLTFEIRNFLNWR